MTNSNTFTLPKLENMTEHQKQLRRIICSFRNELIGGQENHYYDTNEADYNKECPAKNFTKSWAVESIYHWVMDNPYNEKYLHDNNMTTFLERKHIRFMGEQFIRALIEDRVEYDYKKNGWDFPNEYSARNSYADAIEQLKSHKYYHFKSATKERWFEIIKVTNKTVKMCELPQRIMHSYKLKGDVLKEMVEDNTATCEDTYGGAK